MFSRHFLFVNVGRFATCFFLFNALALAQAPFRILHAFGGPNDGIYPDGQLLQDKSGNVYGTTEKGGSGYGTAFELSPSNGHWNETILYSFPGSASNLQGPSSNLVMDGAGNLYGTTFWGGAADVGTIFELSPSDGVWKETTIYEFPSNTVGSPLGLVIGSKGALYGTSTYGNFAYELAPPTSSGGNWRFGTLFTFNNGSDGSAPMPQGGALTADKHGNLYGTTFFGGVYGTGEVFELSPSATAGGSWSESVLYSFGGYGADGLNPEGAVVLDAAGNIYGTTPHGGTYSDGTLWQLSPPAAPGDPWTEAIVHNFAGSPNDGAVPYAGLVIDKSGNLYGVSYQGGALTLGCPGGTIGGCGTVYEFSPTGGEGWTEIILHNFQGDPDGYYPWGGLIINGYGQLYGTTSRGGNDAYNAGVVFEITP